MTRRELATRAVSEALRVRLRANVPLTDPANPRCGPWRPTRSGARRRAPGRDRPGQPRRPRRGARRRGARDELIGQGFATVCNILSDCIERGDWLSLPDELGDLLFQIVFYARIAQEEGRFDFDGIVTRIVDKLTRRHPHIFGDAPTLDSTAQKERWEQLKAEERRVLGKGHSALDDVPLALPALMRAAKLQSRAARVGFDWPEVAPVFEKLQEEVAELRDAIAQCAESAIEAEMGDLLFPCVNLARHLGLEPETALRQAHLRVEARFRHMEQAAQVENLKLAELDPAAQDELWRAAKRALD